MRSLFRKKELTRARPRDKCGPERQAEGIYDRFFRPLENIVNKAIMDHRYGAVRHGIESFAAKFSELQHDLDSEDADFIALGSAFSAFFLSVGQRAISEADSATLMLIMEKMVQLSSSMPTARFTACYELFHKAIDDLMAQAEKRFESRKAELMELKLRMADAQAKFAQKAGHIPEEVAPTEREPESAREIYLEDAIESYNEALEFYHDAPPSKIAAINNNLGAAYLRLSEVRDKEDNLNRAIEAFREALKVYTLAAFPMDYAATQNNLGVAYGDMAEVRDKEENLSVAIEAYREALKVFTFAAFPVQYAATQNNLGFAYRGISEVRDREKNLTLSIQAFNEALRIYTEKDFPDTHKKVKANLQRALDMRAVSEANLKERGSTL